VTARRLVLLVLSVVVALLAIVASASAQEAPSSTDEPTTVVVLVDLSGSLSVDDFAEEVRAVGIMNTVPGIEMYVIGFASEGTLPAIQVVCEPGDDLAECTKDLARRSSAEGNDTDHAAALAGAAAVLGSAEAASDGPRVVLVMTDGDYDPHGGGSPTEADRARLSLPLAGVVKEVIKQLKFERGYPTPTAD
jgi:Mg-chelatase subunit ChlD